MRHADQRGVQLDQVDAFDGGMLERLRDAAACAAADEQNAPRRRMLQQRVVNRLFGGAFIRRAGKDEAVFIEAANVAGLGDRQVAVDRVARCEQVKAAPLARLRLPFHPRRNLGEKKDCEQRSQPQPRPPICLRLMRNKRTAAINRFKTSTMPAIWNGSRKRSNTRLATIPPMAEPAASSR